MDSPTLMLLCIFLPAVLLAIFLFKTFKGRGSLSLKTFIGTFKAKAENFQQVNPSNGIRVKDANAGGNIRLLSTSETGIDGEKMHAKGSIDVLHTPTQPPPKA